LFKGTPRAVPDTGFRGHGVDRFGSFGRGARDGYVESGGGMIVRRSPPRDQYEFGRGRNFESYRAYEPRFFLSWCLNSSSET
jgi:hypothetical protein